MTDNDLYRPHSFASCIHLAYSLLMMNIKTIFLKTWFPAFLLALISSTAVFLPSDIPPATSVWGLLLRVLSCVFYVLVSICCLIWLSARFIGLLNEQSLTVNLMRYAKITLVTLLLLLILGGISAAATFAVYKGTAANPQHFASVETLVVSCLTLLGATCLLPVGFSEMKYLMENGHSIWSLFGKPYRTGWHYWGFLFMVLFLTAILFGIIWGLCNMPLLVVYFAQLSNDIGMAMGDPSGLPKVFPFLSYLIATLTSFASVYLVIWAKCVQYYAYGNIEARVEKKKASAHAFTIKKEESSKQ